MFSLPENAKTLLDGNFEAELLKGGRNNRVFLIKSPVPMVLKEYFSDSRDRFSAETDFIRFLHSGGLKVPELLKTDTAGRLALYEYISGKSVSAQEAGDEDFRQLAEFIADINSMRNLPGASLLRNASESAFSAAEHLDIFRRRLSGFKGKIDNKEAVELIRVLNIKAEEKIKRAEHIFSRAGIDTVKPLETRDRILSPSDFGLHNVVKKADGRLVFIDFEYAGWDDPVKLMCDIFAQPDMKTDFRYFEMFMEIFLSLIDNKEKFKIKTDAFLPLFVIKWCCIMLNDFNPAHIKRREFAQTQSSESRKKTQLKRTAEYIKRFEKLNIL